MIFYVLTALVLAAVLLLYFRLAERYNITDRPNERSSHRHPTVRGWIIFPLAAILWSLFEGFELPWMITGLVLVAGVSFLDDIYTLKGRIRLLAQLIASAFLFYQLGILNLPWYIVIPVFILFLGWINGFNFMDGINAITPFYSLVALGTMLWINVTIGFFPAELMILLIIALLIFSFFNARRHARVFAGDVGSVSMAFLLGAAMISLVISTRRPDYVLLFSVYAVDIVITILYRLIRRENIFRAHRSHLYQWLANELKWPHVLVAALYACVQLMINILTILLIRAGKMDLTVMLIMSVALTVTYLAIRVIVRKRIKEEREPAGA